MSNVFTILIAPFLLLIPTITFGAMGGVNGGGGGAAVTRDANHQIVSAVLVDLYEGKYFYNYQIPVSNDSVDSQLSAAIARIPDEGMRVYISNVVVKTLNLFQFLPSGVGLAPSTDLGMNHGVPIPEGSAVEPIGFYGTDQSLNVSQAVFAKLSNTDRAAFIMHESLYSIDRDLTNDDNSSSSRQAVAALFASSLDETTRRNILLRLFKVQVVYSVPMFVLIDKDLKTISGQVHKQNLTSPFWANQKLDLTISASFRVYDAGAAWKIFPMEPTVNDLEFSYDIREDCSQLRIWAGGIYTGVANTTLSDLLIYHLILTEPQGGTILDTILDTGFIPNDTDLAGHPTSVYMLLARKGIPVPNVPVP